MHLRSQWKMNQEPGPLASTWENRMELQALGSWLLPADLAQPWLVWPCGEEIQQWECLSLPLCITLLPKSIHKSLPTISGTHTHSTHSVQGGTGLKAQIILSNPKIRCKAQDIRTVHIRNQTALTYFSGHRCQQKQMSPLL